MKSLKAINFPPFQRFPFKMLEPSSSEEDDDEVPDNPRGAQRGHDPSGGAGHRNGGVVMGDGAKTLGVPGGITR